MSLLTTVALSDGRTDLRDLHEGQAGGRSKASDPVHSLQNLGFRESLNPVLACVREVGQGTDDPPNASPDPEAEVSHGS